ARQGAFQDVKELVGASQKVTHGLNLNSHGGVFHAHRVLQGGLEDGTSDALGIAVVIQRSNNQPVAQVEICLPVNRVIFIRPGHVPDSSSRPSHGRESVGSSTQGVFRVIPLDK